MEETGFDISSRISKTDFIEVHLGQDGLRQQRSKLFIIAGVSPAKNPMLQPLNLLILRSSCPNSGPTSQTPPVSKSA